MKGSEKILPSKTERQRLKKERNRLKQEESRLKREVSSLENNFESLSEQIEEIEIEMGEANFYSRSDHLEKIKQYQQLKVEQEEVTALWEEKAIELEELEEEIKKKHNQIVIYPHKY